MPPWPWAHATLGHVSCALGACHLGLGFQAAAGAKGVADSDSMTEWTLNFTRSPSYISLTQLLDVHSLTSVGCWYFWCSDPLPCADCASRCAVFNPLWMEKPTSFLRRPIFEKRPHCSYKSLIQVSYQDFLTSASARYYSEGGAFGLVCCIPQGRPPFLVRICCVHIQYIYKMDWL